MKKLRLLLFVFLCLFLSGNTWPFTLPFNNVQYATSFAGADWGARVQHCIDALPSVGGTCDARGLYGTQTWSSNVNLGSLTKQITLLMGPGTYNRSSGIQMTMHGAAGFSDRLEAPS